MPHTNKQTHYAIDTSNAPLSKQQLKELKDQAWLKEEAGPFGLVFSNHTLDAYLDEEYRHGNSILTKDGDLLKTKSSGERKRLLLAYQLAQNPDFLILDNPFDALDIQRVASLKKELQELAKSTVLLQLFRRSDEVLPCCTVGLTYQEGQFVKVDLITEQHTSVSINHEQKLPEPLEAFKNVPDELISFRNVSVSFDEKPVLKDITWTVKRGSSWHLKGPNGAGKTTLLSMVTGDSTKGYGKELYLFGRKKGSGETVWEIKQKIGYFTSAMTERFDGMHDVQSMIISGLYDSVGLYQKPTTLEQARAEEWLVLLGLKQLSGARFRTLNEVQKRLILIARAMIKHPPLLILDEPTAALNETGAALIVSLINKIAASGSTSVLYVSHKEEVGLELFNELLLVQDDCDFAGYTAKIRSS
ncbi:ATP-binding cassette domain-containing protein [Leeuwenhoekiella palythoae]|uniref:Molybdate transport system ATP-binding protein n=1 Tax=Leeuwenhoekiella palythoae TaxID=573501 RepID=A0A1M5Y872_9FLAO|nr:ATP-binding cassette domain-containing protein [Leeuwenhoekiella palythoae]RXG30558.1 molybdate transport system ATP-binding protein [Leeuwenhoekiella palythoae]SHI08290.1 molybdate transport system ATP-binding protein [Leeuwenhoekiella palythoae]